ncbi:cytochrome P450 [Mycobacterium syngnathidarum]
MNATGSPATRRPPGPGLLQLAKMSVQFAREPFALLPEVARRYGDVVNIPIPMPGMTMTLVSHPDHVHHVMTRHHTTYGKHQALRELVVGEDDVIPMMDGGEEWRRWRRCMNPHFNASSMTTTAPKLRPAITHRVDAWARHGSTEWIDLEHELDVAITDGAIRAMFSIALDDDTLRRFLAATRDYGDYMLTRAVTYTLPQFIPRPFQKRGEAAKSRLLEYLDMFISRRNAEGARVEPDVLDTLMAMSYEGCPEKQHRRLRADLAGLVMAAFETTTEAVAWTIALLHRHPSSLAKAYDEVDSLGGAAIEQRQIDNLRYLRACFDEAQRVQGFPISIRTATEDDEIGGYFIPKGSDIALSPYGLQRDPRFWTAPDEFRPERFLDDRINRNAFIPFNVGPHKCMGWRFAYTQGLIALGTILQRYRFAIQPGWQPHHKVRHVSVGLVGGLPVRILPR